MKTEKYIILESELRYMIESEVNKYLPFGYIPLGNITVYIDTFGKKIYLQAIYKA